MLTGKPPIEAQKREEIPSAQKNLKSIPNNLSPACQDLLSRLLAYDPCERISFDELFNHPFICKEEQKDDHASEALNKAEVDKIEATGDDFVLLDDQESCTDFVFLRPDTHPAINLTEFISTVNQKIEVSEIIVKLASKLKNNKELIGAFALFIKSSKLLEQAVNHSQELIKKHHLVSSSYPTFFEQSEKVKQFFAENKGKTDELCIEIENMVEEQKKVAKIEGNLNETLAEALIYNYSITLCKEAAKDEYLRDYSKARDKYKEAIVLLDFLSNYSDNKNPDWVLFENFRSETHIRHETVNVKLTTA